VGGLVLSMVRLPSSWRGAVTGIAGSQPARSGAAVRRIPVPPGHLFTRPVTVDLGNDGMAPVATFAGDGTAQAFCGPASSGDSWSLDQCSASTSVGILDPAQCVVYAGPLPLANFQVAPSFSGGGAQFGLGGVAVPFGWFFWALWTGGTPGAFAYLRVTGQKTTLTN
jgi:hypothetical protein